MWTSENRGRYDRSKLRYPSDLTDQEWAVISPLIPPARRGGNKRTVVVREIVDTQGFLMQAIVHSPGIQDRDGGVLLMGALFGRYPSLLKLYADSGYQGPKFREELKKVCRKINVEIVKRSDVGKFVVLPKPLSWFACKSLPGNGWVAERTIGWLNRCRRLAKDWECLNQNALAFL